MLTLLGPVLLAEARHGCVDHPDATSLFQAVVDPARRYELTAFIKEHVKQLDTLCDKSENRLLITGAYHVALLPLCHSPYEASPSILVERSRCTWRHAIGQTYHRSRC